MKKTRLLEIIREEIAGALNEAGLGDQIQVLQKTKDNLERKIAPIIKQKSDISKKIADLERKQADAEVKSSSTLEEEILNETPIYDINDMEGFKSTLNKFREEGISKSKALNLLLKKLEDEGTVDTNALSKEYNVDTATFNNQEIRKFLNRPEDQMYTDKSGNELIDFSPFLDKSNKPKGPRKKPEGSETDTEPKEKTALPDSGITKKATLTKGDDGFDDVNYSKPKKEEPKKAESKKEEPKKAKESSEEKATTAAKGGSKLDKISDDKDTLLKAIAKAEKERLAIADKRKNAKSEAEKAKLLDDLKRINKLEGELKNRRDKLGY